MKLLQNFHSMNTILHGQVSVWVRTLQMNVVMKHHGNVSSFRKCYRPNRGPLGYREKWDVVSFLHGAFTHGDLSLHTTCSAVSGAGRGACSTHSSPCAAAQGRLSFPTSTNGIQCILQGNDCCCLILVFLGGNPSDLHLISQNTLALFQQLES